MRKRSSSRKKSIPRISAKLDDRQLQNMKRVANVTASVSVTGEVCGFALAMLSSAGLTVENGYFMSLYEASKNGDWIRIHIEAMGRKVVVIECTVATSSPNRIRQELQAYMLEEHYPNALIVYPSNTVFMSLEVEDKAAEVKTGPTLHNVNDIEKIVDILARMGK